MLSYPPKSSLALKKNIGVEAPRDTGGDWRSTVRNQPRLCTTPKPACALFQRARALSRGMIWSFSLQVFRLNRSQRIKHHQATQDRTKHNDGVSFSLKHSKSIFKSANHPN